MTCDGCDHVGNYCNFSFTARNGKQAHKLCQFCSGKQMKRLRKDSPVRDDIEYCLYDGPNDPERYMGGGEFDTDGGYFC